MIIIFSLNKRIIIFFPNFLHSQREPRNCKEVITIGIYEGEEDPEDFSDLMVDSVTEFILYEREGFPFR